MSWGEYAPRKRVKGGIIPQSKRGPFGETWWGRRWMETLESFGMDSRLVRGRTYARGGQVLTLSVESGTVKATVQGSQSKPYNIRIQLAVYPATSWEKITETLRGEPSLTARLLAGEMPEEIETVFTKTGLPLFPSRQKDLQSSCSCPDSSNPCKHLAAVYCLLAEEFDRDPFLLFSLRGRDRDALLAKLVGADAAVEEPAPPLPPEPLSPDATAFWLGASEVPFSFGPAKRPPVSAPIVRRLGAFPFWRDAIPLADAIAPLCDTAGERLLLD